jgi:hypothetical protein
VQKKVKVLVKMLMKMKVLMYSLVGEGDYKARIPKGINQ